MKKFRCVVTRTDKYIIEIDENIYGDRKFNEEFSKVFYPFDCVEDHVDHLAQNQARIGDAFIEGYGYVRKNGRLPYSVSDNSKETAKGLNIIIEDEDNDCCVDIEEVND